VSFVRGKGLLKTNNNNNNNNNTDERETGKALASIVMVENPGGDGVVWASIRP